jgi:hypothetical protein
MPGTNGDVGGVRSTQFDQQTSNEAHRLALERARADAEERRAKALMTAATARLILDSIDAENIDLTIILDGAVARTAMKVLNGEVPIRNGSEAAAVVREFTAARVRITGGGDSGGGYTGDVPPDERRDNILEMQKVIEARAAEMADAVADTHTPTPTA